MVGSSLSNGGPQSSQPGTGEQDKSQRATAQRLMRSLKCFHSLWWEIVQIKPQTLWHEKLIPKHVPWVKRGTFLRVTNRNKVSVQRLDRYPFPCMSLTCPSCVPGVSLAFHCRNWSGESEVETAKWNKGLKSRLICHSMWKSGPNSSQHRGLNFQTSLSRQWSSLPITRNVLETIYHRFKCYIHTRMW